MSTVPPVKQEPGDKSGVPPTIIVDAKAPAAETGPVAQSRSTDGNTTVNTSNTKDADDNTTEFRQAKTPKHTNKSMSLSEAAGKSAPPRSGPTKTSYPPEYAGHPQRGGVPPYGYARQDAYRGSYDDRYYGRRPEQMGATVSPGAGYYAQARGTGDDYRSGYHAAGGRYADGTPYGRQGDYGRYDAYSQSYGNPGYAHPPPMPGAHQPQMPFSRYPDRAYHPPYPQPATQGRHPPYPPAARVATEHPQPQHGPMARAVSTSFDRERTTKPNTTTAPKFGPSTTHGASGDAGSVGGQSDESSWQLNQVASIDEQALQERLNQKRAEKRPEQQQQQPPSNSSSLTNSPSDEKPPLPTPSKLTGLDSLSSVASREEPIDTSKQKEGPPSPGSSTASLDLMKCHSGSSGLLHGFPTHHRDSSPGGSVPIPPEYQLGTTGSGGKRGREGRGDIDTNAREGDDIRSTDSKEPPNKKNRNEKEIECSPPSSPKTAPPQTYFDKPPTYSYSNDSVNRYAQQRQRPGSASSSTMTPMEQNRGELGGLPSWDLHAQDSFGNVSQGPMMNNFSFSHEYPSLSQSGSNLDYAAANAPAPTSTAPAPRTRPPSNAYASVVESRNQSFDGYSQQSSYSRSDTNEGYGRRTAPPPQQQSYSENYKQSAQQQFPPSAPTWTSTQSANTYNSSYQGYASSRAPHPNSFGMPPRAFSADDRDERRASNFHPEFAAPHQPMLRRPPPAVYIMSSANANTEVKKRGTGVFSWTKDDDNRLAEVMKKYKNPRDWEPIAKEHGRGKSAKECHDRWIRYLKPGVRKGQWQDHEDAIVVEAVTTSSEQPFTRWSDLANRLPGRVGKQIRDRWVNHLNPNINHMPFSREDDLLLWEGHKKLGKRWVEISTKFFHQTRSENHIKNRWYSASFKKFIANEFGPDAYSGGKGSASKGKKKKAAIVVKQEHT